MSGIDFKAVGGSSIALVSIIKLVKEVYESNLTFKSLFFGPEKSRDFCIRAELILEENPYEGYPVEGKRSLEELGKEVVDLISLGNDILLSLREDGKNYKKHKLLLRSLVDLKHKVMSKLMTSRKPVPFSILLWGLPAQGKSYMHSLFFNTLCSVLKMEKFNEGMVFTPAFEDDHWDGYDPLSQPFLKISELGFESDDLLKQNGDPRMNTFLSISDGAPIKVKTADMHEKQKNLALFKGVLMDSNRCDAGLHLYKKVPGAYYRRFDRIEVELKDSYCLKDTKILDPSKLSADGKLDLSAMRFRYTYYCPEGKIDEIKKFNESRTFRDCDWKYLVPSLDAKDTWIENINDLIYIMSYRMNKHFIKEENNVNISKHFNLDFEERFGSCIFNPDIERQIYSVPSHPSQRNAVSEANYRAQMWDGFLQLEHEPAHEEVEVEWMNGRAYVRENEVLYDVQTGVPAVISYFFPRHIYVYVGLTIAIVIYLIIGQFFAAFIFFIALIYDFNYMHFLLWLALRIFFGRERSYVYLQQYMEFTRMLARWRDTIHSYWQIVKMTMHFVFSTRGLFVVFGLTFYIALKYFRIKRYLAETSTYSNVEEMEAYYNCGQSYRRVPTTQQNIWNIIDNKFSPVFKSDCFSLENVISRNVVKFQFMHRQQHALALKGDIFITNKHFFQGHEDEFELHMMRDDMIYRTMKIYPKYDLEYFEEDLVLFRFIGAQHRNIMAHIPTLDFQFYSTTGLIDNTEVWIKNQKDVSYFSLETEYFSKEVFEYSWKDHKPGQCGKPLLADVGNGALLLGIHSMGDINSNSSCALPLRFEKIHEKLEKLNSKQSYFRVESLSEGEFPIKNLLFDSAKRSPFRYESLHFLDYYGSTDDKAMVKSKSKLTPRFSEGDIRELFLNHFDFMPDIVYDKPMMQPCVRGGKYYSPYNVGLLKMNKPLLSLNPEVTQRAVSSIVNRILDKLKVPKLQPIDVHSAINGAADDPFIKRVNRSTSAGYGYKGSKDDYLPRLDNEVDSKLCEELEQSILKIIDNYENNVSSHPVYKTALKDEPREYEKCLTGKTRLFYVSSMDNLIVSRMFLSPFYSLMVEQGDIFCTAVGKNPHADFDDLAKDLLDFSPCFMEGDYSGFDINAVLDARYATIRIIVDVLKECGYKPHQLEIVRALLFDNCHIILMLINDVFKKTGLQASGRYATAEDNSLLGLFYLVYAWEYDNLSLEYGDFFDNVKPLLYGDDMIASVKPSVINKFNNITYQRICKEQYNMDFTAATKSLEVESYLKFEDLSFLKRRFVLRKGRYTAPLDMNSLFKTLQWRLPSTVVTQSKQDHDAINSFLIEVFLHCKDDSSFESLRTDVLRFFKNSYPTHDEPFHTLQSVKEILRL
jgi:hypothetical protein